MSLGQHVRTLGRGPGRSRALTFEEAQDAMAMMLSGKAAPEAVGALLMLLRMKGETAEEIAGFSRAAQTDMPALSKADLDWPCYAAGRSRGQPFFLLSVKLIARAGYRVMIHGWNGADRKVREGLPAVGIRSAFESDTIGRVLAEDGMVYAPLERLHPALFELLSLRDVLHLRSCINTVCRMLNPAAANASVQGVFHPSYRLLQADAAQLLGWNSLTVIKGGGGEFERSPAKDIAGFGLRDGDPWQGTFPALRPAHTRLSEAAPQVDLTALWDGRVCSAEARDIVVGTAAAALATLGETNPDQRAQALWDARLGAIAA